MWKRISSTEKSWSKRRTSCCLQAYLSVSCFKMPFYRLLRLLSFFFSLSLTHSFSFHLPALSTQRLFFPTFAVRQSPWRKKREITNGRPLKRAILLLSFLLSIENYPSLIHKEPLPSTSFFSSPHSLKYSYTFRIYTYIHARIVKSTLILHRCPGDITQSLVHFFLTHATLRTPLHSF